MNKLHRLAICLLTWNSNLELTLTSGLLVLSMHKNLKQCTLTCITLGNVSNVKKIILIFRKNWKVVWLTGTAITSKLNCYFFLLNFVCRFGMQSEKWANVGLRVLHSDLQSKISIRNLCWKHLLLIYIKSN